MLRYICLLAEIIHIANAALNHTKYQDECTITPDNPCDFSEMTRLTLVYPGGKTHCSDGSGYGFRVMPGVGKEKDNVLLFFQGGGGCFGPETCEPIVNGMVEEQMGTKLYFDKLNQNGLEGVLNQTDHRNYFRRFTIIHVMYCTADTHIGDNITPVFTGPGIKHNGINNVEAVLEWFYRNLPTPSQLVISGCIAGSIGAQVWSGKIISHVKEHSKSTKITFVGDSYMGLIPRDKSGLVASVWGSCNYDFGWTPEIKMKCDQKRLYLPEFIAHVIKQNPDVQFAFIQAKGDRIQKLFYCLVEIGLDATDLDTSRFFSCIPQAKFEQGVEGIIELYRSMGGNNVRTYFLDDDYHCYMPDQLYHVAISQHNECLQPLMRTWVEDVVEGRTVDDIPACAETEESPPLNLGTANSSPMISFPKLTLALAFALSVLFIN